MINIFYKESNISAISKYITEFYEVNIEYMISPLRINFIDVL